MKTVLNQRWNILSLGYTILLVNQLLTSRSSVTGYNFDDENLIVYTDPGKLENARSSYFGYTVSILKCNEMEYEDNYPELCNWLYVGAPRGNATILSNTFEPGNLYPCKIGAACSESVEFEQHYEKTRGFIRTGQNWVGGSLAVRDVDEKQAILACGWRWPGKANSGNPYGLDGICYTMDFHAGEGNKSPKVTEIAYDKLGPLDQAKCSANTKSSQDGEACSSRKRIEHFGMSVDICPTKFDLQFVIGNIVNDTMGATMMCKKSSEGIECNERYTSPKLYDDYNYFGYAVSSGSYTEEGQLRYAVGGPRSRDLTGQVIIHDFPNDTMSGELKSILTLNGTEFGEYFGASLASCNIQGDGRDELIVGAPFSDISNRGRVYVYGVRKKEFELLFTLDGNVTNGRFGSVITCLGDVDMDGYEDLAIGEPYANGGNVYIYNGHSDGLRRIPSQTISAPPGLRGFGISISKAQDLDLDGFADFAVGAYLSGDAVVIRSKAIVELQVSLPDPHFTEVDGSNPRMKYFTSQICSSCIVVRNTNQTSCANLNIKHKVHVDGIAGFVAHGNASTKALDHGKWMSCEHFTVTVNKMLPKRGLIPKIVGTARIQESNRNKSILTIGPGFETVTKFDAVSAVANPYTSNTTVTRRLPSLCSCQNQICKQNLSVEVTSDLGKGNKYIIGSKKLRISVTVTNHGDDAYEPRVRIVIPKHISLVRAIPSNCESPEESSQGHQCYLSNMLPKKWKETIHFDLDTSQVTSNRQKMTFETYTSSRNEIERSKEIAEGLVVQCIVDYNITMTAESSQISYPFVKTASTGIAFDHKYFIGSVGHTPIERAKLNVSVPTHWNGIKLVEITKYPPDCKVLQKNSALYLESQNSSWLFLRCAEALVHCTQIQCDLTEVERDNTISLSFQINPYKLPTDDERNDDLFFATNGTVDVDDGYVASQPWISMSSEAVTKFVAREQATHADELTSWIIPTSVFLGLLLLGLLSFGLYKIGFFARKKKKELEMLQNNEDEHFGTAMQMTSSTEVLDGN